jgi:hypothetical protein
MVDIAPKLVWSAAAVALAVLLAFVTLRRLWAKVVRTDLEAIASGQSLVADATRDIQRTSPDLVANKHTTNGYVVNRSRDTRQKCFRFPFKLALSALALATVSMSLRILSSD